MKSTFLLIQLDASISSPLSPFVLDPCATRSMWRSETLSPRVPRPPTHLPALLGWTLVQHGEAGWAGARALASQSGRMA